MLGVCWKEPGQIDTWLQSLWVRSSRRAGAADDEKHGSKDGTDANRP
jgi:hypothetical protein